MPARILDGAALAATVRAEVAARAAALRARGVRPRLAAALVGDDPASAVYVRSKEKACAEVGIEARIDRLPTATTADLLRRIEAWNADKSVHGILIQLPLPPSIEVERVLDAIDPAKDVDCFHPANLGLLVSGRPRFVPCTPKAILRLLDSAGVATRGAETVLVGYGFVVGQPLSILLALKGREATVTVCHIATVDVSVHARRAEILVAAVGRPGVVPASWVRPGAAVIDVGVNRVPDPSAPRGWRLVGDVDPAAREVAGAITPVPGGVGPMTVACLLENVVEAAEAASR